MFGNLRFIAIFENFLLPKQGDRSAHCFYYLVMSSGLKMQQHFVFPMEISVLEFQAWQID